MITVLVVGVIALGFAFSLTLDAGTELTKDRNTKFGIHAFYTADASAREGAYQYLGEYAANGEANYSGGTTSLLNGSLNNTISVETEWPFVEIIGEADNNLTSRKVIYTITLFPEGEAFENAVYAQDLLVLGGSMEINGNIFANSGIDFNGNKAQLNGNAYSPSEIEDTDNINGAAVSGVDEIPAPVLDTQPYQDIAEANGTLFDSPSAAESYLNNQTREAIVVVNSEDQTSVQGSGTSLTGSLVTLGDLNILGGTYTGTEGMATIVVIGNLRISGGATINGLVYVSGETSFGGGNNTINGTLISTVGATVTNLTGNAQINYDSSLSIWWQDLLGLNTTSSIGPKIINWREE